MSQSSSSEDLDMNDNDFKKVYNVSDEFDVDKRVINPMQMQWNRTAAIVRVIVKPNTEDKGAEGDN